MKCELATEVLRSSGNLRLQVTGWSMLPTVWPGDTLLIERVSSSSISEGDIILFGRERRLFAHRVVAKDVQRYSPMLTRGDAMKMPDPPVHEHEILGKVCCIVRNGKQIQPRTSVRLCDRAVAGLVRFSDVSARVVVGVHDLICE